MLLRIALILLMEMPCRFVNAADLQILSKENPPRSFTKNGKLTGVAVEIVNEIQRRSNNKTTIKMLPWARAYDMLKETPNVALFVMVRTPEREKMFKWVGPLMQGGTSFYSRSGAPVQIENLQAAKSVSAILVARGFYSEEILVKEGFTNLMIANDTDKVVKMLLAGRAPLMVMADMTLDTVLADNGVSRSDVALSYTFARSENYIAFSHDTNDAIVKEWQDTLDQMKRDGTFAQIFKKWLPGALNH